MARIYARLIRNGTITMADVPYRWKEKVAALLNEEG